MGKLSYNRKIKKLEYAEAPFDAVFTIELAEAVLDAPAEERQKILSNLSPTTRESFLRIVTLDEKLMAKFESAAVAQRASKPPKNDNCPIDVDEVVDQLMVNLAPIISIIFMADGSRYVETRPNDLSSLVTFAKFRKDYKSTVEDMLEHRGAEKIAEIERAMEILRAKPQTYEVGLATRDLSVTTKTITVFHKDQVAAYASRIGATILDATLV
jgi:hypothetical protein